MKLKSFAVMMGAVAVATCAFGKSFKWVQSAPQEIEIIDSSQAGYKEIRGNTEDLVWPWELAGSPATPYRVVSFAVPDGCEAAGASVACEVAWRRVAEGVKLYPVQEPVITTVENPPFTEPDAEIYKSAAWPATVAEAMPPYIASMVQVLPVKVNLIRYLPLEGAIEVAESLKVTVTFPETQPDGLQTEQGLTDASQSEAAGEFAGAASASQEEAAGEADSDAEAATSGATGATVARKSFAVAAPTSSSTKSATVESQSAGADSSASVETQSADSATQSADSGATQAAKVTRKGNVSRNLMQGVLSGLANSAEIEIADESASTATSGGTVTRRLMSVVSAPTVSSGSEKIDMVIISPPDFMEEWKKYVAYRKKTHPDFKIVIKNTAEIYNEYTGFDEAQKIHKYIEHLFHNNGLEYVLLGGDCPTNNSQTMEGMEKLQPNCQVPTRYGDSGNEHPSDVYFACMDKLEGGKTTTKGEVWDLQNDGLFMRTVNGADSFGNCDIAPDLVVMRMPLRPSVTEGKTKKRTVTVTQQMDGFTNKLEKCERLDFGGAHRFLFSGSKMFVEFAKGDGNERVVNEREFFDHGLNFFDDDYKWAGVDYINSLRLFISNTHAVNIGLGLVGAVTETYSFGPGLPNPNINNDKKDAYYYSFDSDRVTDEAHGWARGAAWWVADKAFDSTAIHKLHLSPMPCESGWFDYGTPCCSESVVLNNIGGSVAALANCRYGWWGGYNTFSHRVDGLMQNNIMVNKNNVGNAIKATQLTLATGLGTLTGGGAWTFFDINGMGDPLASITPQYKREWAGESGGTQEWSHDAANWCASEPNMYVWANHEQLDDEGKVVGFDNSWAVNVAVTDDTAFNITGDYATPNLVLDGTDGKAIALQGEGRMRSTYALHIKNCTDLTWNAAGGAGRTGFAFDNGNGVLRLGGDAERYFGIGMYNVGEVEWNGSNVTFDFADAKSGGFSTTNRFVTIDGGTNNVVRSYGNTVAVFASDYKVNLENGAELILQTWNSCGTGNFDSSNVLFHVINNSTLAIGNNPRLQPENLARSVTLERGGVLHARTDKFALGNAAGHGITIFAKDTGNRIVSTSGAVKVNGTLTIDTAEGGALAVEAGFASGNVDFTGAGTVTLSGASATAGAMHLLSGANVVVTSARALGAGTVTVEEGATLDLRLIPAMGLKKIIVKAGGKLILPKNFEEDSAYQVLEDGGTVLQLESGALVYGSDNLYFALDGSATSRGSYLVGANLLMWKGDAAGAGTWENSTAFTPFTSGGAAAAFEDGKSVIFGELEGIDTATVTVNGTVAPAFIDFLAYNTKYIFTGSGTLANDDLVLARDIDFEANISSPANKITVSGGHVTLASVNAPEVVVTAGAEYRFKGATVAAHTNTLVKAEATLVLDGTFNSALKVETGAVFKALKGAALTIGAGAGFTLGEGVFTVDASEADGIENWQKILVGNNFTAADLARFSCAKSGTLLKIDGEGDLCIVTAGVLTPPITRTLGVDGATESWNSATVGDWSWTDTSGGSAATTPFTKSWNESIIDNKGELVITVAAGVSEVTLDASTSDVRIDIIRVRQANAAEAPTLHIVSNGSKVFAANEIDLTAFNGTLDFAVPLTEGAATAVRAGAGVYYFRHAIAGSLAMTAAGGVAHVNNFTEGLAQNSGSVILDQGEPVALLNTDLWPGDVALAKTIAAVATDGTNGVYHLKNGQNLKILEGAAVSVADHLWSAYTPVNDFITQTGGALTISGADEPYLLGYTRVVTRHSMSGEATLTVLNGAAKIGDGDEARGNGELELRGGAKAFLAGLSLAKGWIDVHEGAAIYVGGEGAMPDLATAYLGGTMTVAGTIGAWRIAPEWNIPFAIDVPEDRSEGGESAAGGESDAGAEGGESAAQVAVATAFIDAHGLGMNITSPISGRGRLVITNTVAESAGVVTLSATNTYAGGTFVAAGQTLAIAFAESFGTSGVTLAEGAVLDLGEAVRGAPAKFAADARGTVKIALTLEEGESDTAIVTVAEGVAEIPANLEFVITVAGQRLAGKPVKLVDGMIRLNAAAAVAPPIYTEITATPVDWSSLVWRDSLGRTVAGFNWAEIDEVVVSNSTAGAVLNMDQADETVFGAIRFRGAEALTVSGNPVKAAELDFSESSGSRITSALTSGTKVTCGERLILDKPANSGATIYIPWGSRAVVMEAPWGAVMQNFGALEMAAPVAEIANPPNLNVINAFSAGSIVDAGVPREIPLLTDVPRWVELEKGDFYFAGVTCEVAKVTVHADAAAFLGAGGYKAAADDPLTLAGGAIVANAGAVTLNDALKLDAGGTIAAKSGNTLYVDGEIGGTGALTVGSADWTGKVVFRRSPATDVVIAGGSVSAEEVFKGSVRVAAGGTLALTDEGDTGFIRVSEGALTIDAGAVVTVNGAAITDEWRAGDGALRKGTWVSRVGDGWWSDPAWENASGTIGAFPSPSGDTSVEFRSDRVTNVMLSAAKEFKTLYVNGEVRLTMKDGAALTLTGARGLDVAGNLIIDLSERTATGTIVTGAVDPATVTVSGLPATLIAEVSETGIAIVSASSFTNRPALWYYGAFTGGGALSRGTTMALNDSVVSADGKSVKVVNNGVYVNDIPNWPNRATMLMRSAGAMGTSGDRSLMSFGASNADEIGLRLNGANYSMTRLGGNWWPSGVAAVAHPTDDAEHAFAFSYLYSDNHGTDFFCDGVKFISATDLKGNSIGNVNRINYGAQRTAGSLIPLTGAEISSMMAFSNRLSAAEIRMWGLKREVVVDAGEIPGSVGLGKLLALGGAKHTFGAEGGAVEAFAMRTVASNAEIAFTEGGKIRVGLGGADFASAAKIDLSGMTFWDANEYTVLEGESYLPANIAIDTTGTRCSLVREAAALKVANGAAYYGTCGADAVWATKSGIASSQTYSAGMDVHLRASGETAAITFASEPGIDNLYLHGEGDVTIKTADGAALTIANIDLTNFSGTLRAETAALNGSINCAEGSVIDLGGRDLELNGNITGGAVTLANGGTVTVDHTRTVAAAVTLAGGTEFVLDVSAATQPFAWGAALPDKVTVRTGERKVGFQDTAMIATWSQAPESEIVIEDDDGGRFTLTKQANGLRLEATIGTNVVLVLPDNYAGEDVVLTDATKWRSAGVDYLASDLFDHGYSGTYTVTNAAHVTANLNAAGRVALSETRVLGEGYQYKIVNNAESPFALAYAGEGIATNVINFGVTSVLEIPANVATRRMYIGDAKMWGYGTVINENNLPAGTNGYDDAAHWHGTVKFINFASSQKVLNPIYANETSALEYDNVKGYPATESLQYKVREFRIGAGGLDISGGTKNGSPAYVHTFSCALTGTGPITVSGGHWQCHLVFLGGGADYTGAIAVTSGTGANTGICFGAMPTDWGNGSIYVGRGGVARIAPGVTWRTEYGTVRGLYLAGTLVADGSLAGNKMTVVEGATFDLSARADSFHLDVPPTLPIGKSFKVRVNADVINPDGEVQVIDWFTTPQMMVDAELEVVGETSDDWRPYATVDPDGVYVRCEKAFALTSDTTVSAVKARVEAGGTLTAFVKNDVTLTADAKFEDGTVSFIADEPKTITIPLTEEIIAALKAKPHDYTFTLADAIGALKETLNVSFVYSNTELLPAGFNVYSVDGMPFIARNKILINFGSGYGTDTVMGIWNNFTAGSGSSAALKFSNGADAQGAGLTWSAKGIYYTGSDKYIFNGYLDDNNGGKNQKITVKLTAIPFDYYDVQILCAADAAAGFTAKTVNGKIYAYDAASKTTVTTTNAKQAWGARGTTDRIVEGTNAMTVPEIDSDALTIESVANDVGNNANNVARGNIAAVIITDISSEYDVVTARIAGEDNLWTTNSFAGTPYEGEQFHLARVAAEGAKLTVMENVVTKGLTVKGGALALAGESVSVISNGAVTVNAGAGLTATNGLVFTEGGKIAANGTFTPGAITVNEGELVADRTVIAKASKLTLGENALYNYGSTASTIAMNNLAGTGKVKVTSSVGNHDNVGLNLANSGDFTGTVEFAGYLNGRAINLNKASTLEFTAGPIGSRTWIWGGTPTINANVIANCAFAQTPAITYNKNLTINGTLKGGNDASGSAGDIIMGNTTAAGSVFTFAGSEGYIGGKLYGKSATFNIGDGEHASFLAVNRLEIGDYDGSATSALNVRSNATLKITGSNNTFSGAGDYKSVSLIIGEWNLKSSATIEGTLLAQNAEFFLGDNGGPITVSGTLAAKGVGRSCNNLGANYSSLTLADGGRLILGATGVSGTTKNSFPITFNSGTVGAYADATTIAKAATIADGKSVTFDTQKYAFASNGNSISRGDGSGEGAGATITVSGALSGNGGLVKEGAGTLKLTSSANTYAGATTVNAGTLETAATLAGDLTLAAGATLDLTYGAGADGSYKLCGGAFSMGAAATIAINGEPVSLDAGAFYHLESRDDGWYLVPPVATYNGESFGTLAEAVAAVKAAGGEIGDIVVINPLAPAPEGYAVYTIDDGETLAHRLRTVGTVYGVAGTELFTSGAAVLTAEGYATKLIAGDTLTITNNAVAAKLDHAAVTNVVVAMANAGDIVKFANNEGYAIAGETVTVESGVLCLDLANGDPKVNGGAIVIGANGGLDNYGWLTIAGELEVESASDHTIFNNSGANPAHIQGGGALVKSGEGTITCAAIIDGVAVKVTEGTLVVAKSGATNGADVRVETGAVLAVAAGETLNAGDAGTVTVDGTLKAADGAGVRGGSAAFGAGGRIDVSALTEGGSAFAVGVTALDAAGVAALLVNKAAETEYSVAVEDGIAYIRVGSEIESNNLIWIDQGGTAEAPAVWDADTLWTVADENWNPVVPAVKAKFTDGKAVRFSGAGDVISVVGTNIATNVTFTAGAYTFVAGDAAAAVLIDAEGEGAFTVGENAALTIASTFATSDITADGTLTVNTVGGGVGRTVKGGGKVVLNNASGAEQSFGTDMANVLTGGIAVEKTGANKVTFYAAQNYTGGITIREGAVGTSTAGAFGAGAITLAGGTLVDQSGTLTFANAVSVVADSAIHTQANTMNFTGGFTVAAGATLSKQGSGAGGTMNLSGDIAIHGAVAKSAGVVNLSTASGKTIVMGEGARADVNAVTAQGNVTLGANSVLTVAGSVRLSGNGVTGNFSGDITAASGVFDLVNGAKANFLAGTHTFLKMQLNNGNASNNRSEVVIDGAVVNLTATDKVVSPGEGAGGNSALVIGHWGGSATHTLTLKSGTLNISNAFARVAWSSAGAMTIEGGEANFYGLSVKGQPNNSGKSSTFTLAGGRLNLGAGGLLCDGTTARTVNLNGGTLGAIESWSVSATGGNFKLGGAVAVDVGEGKTITVPHVIADGASAGSLTKTGAGTLALTGANTYTGGNTVGEGTVNIGNTGAIGNGKLTLAGGALNTTFEVADQGKIATCTGIDQQGGAVSVNGTVVAYHFATDGIYLGGYVIHPGESVTPGVTDTNLVTIVANNGATLYPKYTPAGGEEVEIMTIAIEKETGKVVMTLKDNEVTRPNVTAMAMPTEGVAFSVANPIPGLWYAVMESTDRTFSEGSVITTSEAIQATGAATETLDCALTIPESGNVKYYKIIILPQPPAPVVSNPAPETEE